MIKKYFFADLGKLIMLVLGLNVTSVTYQGNSAYGNPWDHFKSSIGAKVIAVLYDEFYIFIRYLFIYLFQVQNLVRKLHFSAFLDKYIYIHIYFRRQNLKLLLWSFFFLNF